MAKIRIGFGVYFIIVFSFVLFVGGTMPYFLFYVFLLTFTLPLAHSLITLKRLNGKVDVPTDALFTGDSININYQIQNNSFLNIPFLEINSDIVRQLTGAEDNNVIISLNKKESFTRGETVVLRRRGYYQFGVIEVKIQDVFKFYTFTKKIKNDTSLLVYPETINLSTFKITASQQSGELLVNSLAFIDKSRVNTLREYMEGDSVKAIHWRLSAKKGIPIIKEYENRVDTNSVIFLDNFHELFKRDIDRRMEDKIADIALSIVNYHLNHDIEIILETQNQKELVKIQGQQKSDLKSFLEALARFKVNGLYDSNSMLMTRMDRIKRGSTFIVITTNLDKSMGANGIQMKMKNLAPLYIVVTDMANKNGFIDPEVEKRLKQEGIPVYILDYSTSIKEALEVHNG